MEERGMLVIPVVIPAPKCGGIEGKNFPIYASDQFNPIVELKGIAFAIVSENTSTFPVKSLIENENTGLAANIKIAKNRPSILPYFFMLSSYFMDIKASILLLYHKSFKKTVLNQLSIK